MSDLLSRDRSQHIANRVRLDVFTVCLAGALLAICGCAVGEISCISNGSPFEKAHPSLAYDRLSVGSHRDEILLSLEDYSRLQQEEISTGANAAAGAAPCKVLNVPFDFAFETEPGVSPWQRFVSDY